MKNLAGQASKGGELFAPASGFSLRSLVALLAACLFALSQAGPLRAQQRGSKVPLVSKLSSKHRQQAYSGKVQSLDLKQKILNVTALHGQEREIFPIKKNVRVESLDGGRMKLSALTHGMTVLIYYDQKSGARTVKNIVVLSSGKSQEKGKLAPSS